MIIIDISLLGSMIQNIPDPVTKLQNIFELNFDD